MKSSLKPSLPWIAAEIALDLICTALLALGRIFKNYYSTPHFPAEYTRYSCCAVLTYWYSWPTAFARGCA